MLKELDIFVRSHLSPLKPEQVALMRARWEREKRKLKEAPAPPKRRRVAKVAAAEPVAAAPEARPMRRRRTAAEVAEAEAEAQAEAAIEAERELKAREALEAAKAVDDEAKPSLEERAAALFKDLPAAEESRGEQPTFATAPAATAAPAAPPPPPPSAASFGAPPRPVIPTPVRPKPVASAAPGGGPPAPPRPVASAAPGVGPLEERRRDKGKKRKKGKKSLVDQEAVAQNISRTLASIKGPVARKGVHRRDEGPSFRDIQEEKRREEKEREKTLVRVTEFITVSELANILKVPAKEIVAFTFKELGQMVTINQRLDFDMIELIASAFNFQAVREEEYVVGEGEQAADGRGHLPRQERWRAPGRRDQQDRSARRQRAEGEAGPAVAPGRARGVRRYDARDADLREDRAERGHPARSDPAAGRAARSEGESRPPGPRHCARGDPRPGQGARGHDPRAERHAPGGGRLHLRPVLRARARHVQRARRDGDGRRSLDARADPRLRGCARGGGHLQCDGGCRGGARDRPEAPAPGARGAAPPQRTREDARGLHGGARGRGRRGAAHHHQGGPGRPRGSARGRAGPAVHPGSQGGSRAPRRRRHHRLGCPAREGVGCHHRRLPRATRFQRTRLGRARARGDPHLPHHLRGGGRGEGCNGGTAHAREEGSRAGGGRGATDV